MKKQTIILIIVFTVILFGSFLIFNSNKEAIQIKSDVTLTGETKEFTVEAFQFGFKPEVLEVNLGDKVIINAYTSDVTHGLSIPNFGVNMRLTSSTPQKVEFIADQKGTFMFYCSIPCGSGHGAMRGNLVVR